MKKLLTNKKGAFSIVGLLMSIITLIVYVGFLPTINEVITAALPELDTMTAFVIQLIPLIMLIMIIVGVVTSGKPEYQYVG